MVGLDHQIVGGCYSLANVVGHVPNVGDEAEGHSSVLNAVAHIVCAVVGHGERSHAELANLVG